MSRNGSGVYSLPAGNPVVTGTTISSSWANTTLSDIASALTGSVAADGQTPMTGNLQMGNNKITGLAAGTLSTDAVNLGQITGGSVAGSFTTLSASSTVTLSGGTANGVLYLNGSKVATSGTGLVFDGTNLLVGTTTSNNARIEAAVSASSSYQLAANFTNSTNANFQIKIANSITGIGSSTATPLAFLINSTEQMRLDSSGNLGLGVTPSAWKSTIKAMQVGATSAITNPAGGFTLLTENSFVNSSSQDIYLTSNYASSFRLNSGGFQWYTAPSGTAGNAITFTQAMTLDASGNLLVGTTTSSYTDANSVKIYPSGNGIWCHATGSGSGSGYAQFQYAGANIGTITQNGTTAVAYNTTSDYRLKTDVAPIQNALSTVQALNPVSFTWIDGRKDDGFIAHELQSVLPNCVTGEKDAVNEDGTPKYQQMDNSGVIPFLVKAIQEQQAIIQSLTARLDKAGL